MGQGVSGGEGGTMELKWLEDFLSLANTRSFSRSAEERGVTQPAFSRRIKALEAWIGGALIDRSTYPTTLTQTGNFFRAAAEKIVRELYAQRDEARGHRQLKRSSLSFVALHTLALTYFPAWLGEVEKALGALDTRLAADNLHDCVQALIFGNADFLLSFAHPEVPIWIDPERHPSVHLGTDRVAPYTAPGPDGRARWSLPGRADRPIPFLGYSGETFLGRVVDLAIRRHDKRPPLDTRYENAMAEALKAMALAGHGLAFLPASSVAAEVADGRLVPAAKESWTTEVEIRLWRGIDRSRPIVAALWHHIGG